MTKHKYLTAIGYNFYKELRHDNRNRSWKKKIKKYSVDPRDTWNMDISMITTLYERLKMYEEITIVNTDSAKILWKTKKSVKEITMTEYIKRLIKLCEKIIKLAAANDEYDQKDVVELWTRWATASPYMWW